MRAARWLVALSLAGGCGFSAPDAGSSSDDGVITPDGAAPVDARPDTAPGIDAPTMVDADPHADTDHDGVENSLDNCVMIANTNQRDHDGDHVGDVCDPCPHVGGASPLADDDHDGVGNACDPDKNAPDKLVLFEGFYDDSAWTLNGAVTHDGWTIDQATGTAGGDFRTGGMNRFKEIRWPITVKQAAITASFTPIALGADFSTGNGTYVPAFSTVIGDAGQQGYQCALLIDDSNTSSSNDLVGYADWSTNHVRQQTDWNHAAVMNQAYELDERFDDMHRCDALHGSEQASVVTNVGTIPGTFGITAQIIQARVDYVFVVERSP